jgi:lipopolysaccharide export system protein LptA
MIRRALLAAVFLLAALEAAPAQTATSKEVNIEADRMEIQQDNKTAIFSGNVDAKRNDVRLTTDKLVVYYEDVKQQDGSTKTEVSKLDAAGNVVIVTRSQRITGQAAKMDVKANTLTVTGNVKVVQGQTILQGPTLFVDLNTDKSQLSGGRVRGSFVPQ